MLVNQPDDELLAGAALARHQHGGVERRHPRREFQHVPHGRAADDEALALDVRRDALLDQVHLAFAANERPLPGRERLALPPRGDAQALHLRSEVGALVVEAQALQRALPAVGVAADQRAAPMALADALPLPEVDLAPERGARVAADVPDEAPAHRLLALAVVLEMLFGLVRVKPRQLGVEGAAVGVELEPVEIGLHDALEGVDGRSGADVLERIGPVELIAQVDGVVIAVGEPEAEQEAPGAVDSEGLHQLLAEQPHRRALRITTRWSCSRISPSSGRKSKTSSSVCTRSRFMVTSGVSATISS